MIANYHTHTVRCKHAEGSEEEYIQLAIERGIKTLGFADHAPMPFLDGHYSSYRMTLDEFPDYIETLLSLREKYRGRIELLIGLETEYFPAVFPHFLEFIRPYPVDYLILGQHFLRNEEPGEIPCSKATEDDARLAQYVDQVVEGLQTGCFSYLAHPDVLNYVGDDEVYQREMTRLCQAAKTLDIPLEINLLGLRTRRHYPSRAFWRIAGRVGCQAILGCDAHEVERMADPIEIADGESIAARHGLSLLQTLPLRSIQ